MVAQSNDNFPVFNVLNERSQRSKTLHRNVLFPLGQELQCENIGQRVKVSDPKIETQNTKENSGQTYPDMEEGQGYKGPMTRAKARALEQANVLRTHYFGT